MLSIDTNVFIQIPKPGSQRILHPGRVVAVQEQTFTVEVEAEDVLLEAGQGILVFYEVRGEFNQQPARIEAIMQSESDDQDKTIIGFETVGQPVCAETRECYRVSTVTTDLKVKIGTDGGSYPLLDVSVTGLSFLSPDPFNVGQIVPVELAYGGEQFEGEACVQSTRAVRGDRARYGLRPVVEKNTSSNLTRGLQKISMAVQREHLRRLAGAG